MSETTDNPCPTPWKIIYASRREATQSVKQGRGSNKRTGQMYPYHCACGYWHLTSMKKSLARRIKKTRKVKDDDTE